MDTQRTELDDQLLNALFRDDFKGVENAVKQGASLNTPYTNSGYTPFLKICREHTSPDIIEWAIGLGGSITQTTIQKETPLHVMASKRSSFACLDVLIKHGADINAVDIAGNTPLMRLLSHPQVQLRMDCVYGLYNTGTNCAIKNSKGEIAYDIANNNSAFDDDEFLLHLLIDSFADEQTNDCSTC